VTGYLERLVGRARADATGLRPRPPSRFAPVSLLEQEVDVATDAATPSGRARAPMPGSPAAPTARAVTGDTSGRFDSRLEDGPATPRSAGNDGTAVAELAARPGQLSSEPRPTVAPPVSSRGRTSHQREPTAAAERGGSADTDVSQATATRPSDAPQSPRAVTAVPTASRSEATPIARTARPNLDRRSADPGVEKHGPDVVIEVSIGRVEIPSPQPAAPARPDRRPPTRPPLDLSDYLKQRRAGR